MRHFSRFQILGLVGLLGLVGCGGGGIVSNATGGSTSFGTEFSRDAGVTARIEIDPTTNTAKVTNLNGTEGDSRAIWQGNSISVASAEVFQLPGTTISSRVLRLVFKNNTAIPIGVNEPLIATLATATPEFSTLTEAGVGTNSLTNGAVSAASIGTPRGVWQDADGTVYVAQGSGNGIRKIFNGAVTTIAQGYQNVYGITGDPNGDFLYLIERDRHRIIKLRKDGNEGSILVGGPNAGDDVGSGTNNQFNTPTGICFGGGELFVADLGNGKIKRVSNLAGTPTVSLVMSGVASAYGVDYGTIQDRPFLAATSQSTGQIYAIDPTTNKNALIRTLPVGVTGVGVNDGRVVVANATQHTITSLRVPDGSNIYNIASWAQEFVSAAGAGFTDGIGMKFNAPLLVSTGGRNGFLVADSLNHRLRRVILPNYVPGNSVQPNVNITNSQFKSSTGRHGFTVGQLSAGATSTIDVGFTVEFEAAMTFYVTVSGGTNFPIALDGNTNAPATNVYGRIIAGGIISTIQDGQGATAGIGSYGGIVCGPTGDMYIGDGRTIRKVSSTGKVITVGNTTNGFTPTNGNGFVAQFPSSITGLTSNDDGSLIFFTSGNQVWLGSTPGFASTSFEPSAHSFFRIGGDAGDASGNAVGDGDTVRFFNPSEILYDEQTNSLYVCDTSNHRILIGRRKGTSVAVPSNWDFTVFAGTGVAGFSDTDRFSAQFNTPDGLALGGDNALYVADNFNKRLRRIDLITGQVTTAAGDGNTGYQDGSPGQLNSIRGLASDGGGSIYLYDFWRLRVFRNGRLYTVTTDGPGAVSDGYVDGAGQQRTGRITINRRTGTIYTSAAAV
ncbi:MAG: hypothetical protein KF812_13000, partial [Fimbriimonadaceae bacterium]|nr:hypothetical protein [Fimbriimonadaceae bacterium]